MIQQRLGHKDAMLYSFDLELRALHSIFDTASGGATYGAKTVHGLPGRVMRVLDEFRIYDRPHL